MNHFPATLDDGFCWIESLTNFERRAMDQREYRLDRMERILAVLGHPEKHGRIIHIAGSKGKGSTAAMIAGVLTAAGYSTAVYTSPHVRDYRERFRLVGRMVPDELLLQGVRKLYSECSLQTGTLFDCKVTTFELLTALFFFMAREMDAAYSVVETGIGGRLDATNVVERPLATVCTTIELEHMEILGNTIPQIAAEKAGILKPDTPVFIGMLNPEADAVFQSRSQGLGIPLHRLSALCHTCRDGSLELADGMQLRPDMRMLGSVQLENAALAAAVVHNLCPDIPAKILEKGLSATSLPGRMQLLPGNPPILVDGAHTVESIRRNLSTLNAVMPAGGSVIFGAVRGKNSAAMAKLLSRHFSHAIICRPGTFKPSDPELLAAEFRRWLPSDAVRIIEDANAAMAAAGEHAQAPGQGICVMGSFYLAGKILQSLDAAKSTACAV